MNSIPITSVGKRPEDNSYGSLIEDWPHNKPAQDHCTSSKKRVSTGKRVRFSSSSSCRVYFMDPSYETNKSYTKAKQKAFGRSAMTQVINIRRSLATLPYYSFDRLNLAQIESLGITREEILGLEHLALTPSPSAIMKLRKSHVQMILLEQEKQEMIGVGDDSILARLSALASRKSVEQARIRAGENIVHI